MQIHKTYFIDLKIKKKTDRRTICQTDWRKKQRFDDP